MASYSISEVAERSGLPPSTLRYYEAIDLLAPVPRNVNGYRVYDEDLLRTAQFIGRAKGLGISIEELRLLVPLWHDGECPIAHEAMRELLEEKLTIARETADQTVIFGRQLQGAYEKLTSSDPPAQCSITCTCVPHLE